MSATALHGATATAVAAATTQPDQISALKTQFGTSDVTVRAMAGGTIAEVGTYGQWALDSLTPRGMTLGALAASTVNVPDATITSFVFVAGSTPIFSIPASDVGLDSPTTKTGRRTSLADAVLTKHRIIADATLPLGTALTYLLTFALADTATVDVAIAGSIVNTGTGACAWSITPPAHVSVTPSSGTLAAGGTQSLSVLIDTAGTYSLTLVSSGTTITGATQTVVVSEPAEAGTFPTVPTTGLATLALTPASTGTHAWSLGHTFKLGDLPAGSALSGIQCTVKSTWPDGSAKIAVLAGGCPMTSGVARTVGLQIGAAPGGAVLSTSTLAGYLTDPVTVDAGAFGSASWSGADWSTPFMTWVSGPLMSSWVYRKPIGSDAHLVAWLEVRLWTNGEVEVLPWIENGYVRVLGPTNKSATYSFTMGGTQRFSAAIDIPNHCRTPLLSGAALSHWLGADKGVVVKHDPAYMQGTRLVPTYSAVVAPDAGVVTSLPATFTPLQVGSFTATMGVAGYQPSIGLLPEWDVLYLTSTSSSTWAAVQRNGYSAGRWCAHYRDENTNRPMRFSDFPNISRNASTTGDYVPAETGTESPYWDIPHHPSVGFMAYLITGRFFHMEEVMFAATRNYLHQVNSLRQYSAGIFLSQSGASTTRGAAWAIRTLAQAATVSPDSDPLHAEFVASLEANVNYNHTRYIAQANNPFGFVETYGDNSPNNDGRWTTAGWQQDFYTAVFGYMLAMNPPVSSGVKTKIAEFFAWKAKSIIGRLGGTGATEWLYRDAAPYTMTLATNDAPDWATGTGPWPANWRELYDLTYDGTPNSNPSPGAFEDGPLRGGNIPAVSSYWANLQPAIAYAVEHAVPGASAAWARMTSASNWPTFEANFNSAPVWSVVGIHPATSLTLGVPSTGTAGVAVTVTVTPNGPIAGGGTATLSTTAGTLGSTTLTWAPGESGAKTTTLLLADPGSADVSLTTGLSLSISGSPASFTASTLALPAWVPAAGSGTAVNINLNTLHELNPCPENTCWYSKSSKNAAMWRNWNGAVLAKEFSAYGAIVHWGGGHGGGADVGMYLFDFTTCLWSRVGPDNPPTDYSADVDASEYCDYLYEGSYIVPALHTYNYPAYIPPGSPGVGSKGAALLPLLVGGANSGDKPHMIDLETGVWSRAATNFVTGYLGSSPYCGSIEDTTRNRVWWAGTGSTSMRWLDLTEAHPRTMHTHVIAGGNNFAFGGYYSRHVYVPEADMAVGIWLRYQDTTPVRGEVFDMSSGVPVRTATLDSALPAFTINGWDGGPGPGFGMDWCPITQAFYLFEGPGATRVIKLTPSSLDFASCAWTFSTESYTNSAVGLNMGTWGAPGAGSQPFSKWRWIDGLKCFCWSDGPTSSGVCRDGVTRTGLMQIWRPAGT